MNNLMSFQRENVKVLQGLSNKKDGDFIVKFTTTTSSIYSFFICTNGTFGNSLEDNKHALGMGDISADIENTLHLLLDAKKTPEEIYLILGAFIPTDEQWEDMEEFQEYYNIDLDYCIDGLIMSCEPVQIPEKTENEKRYINSLLENLFFEDNDLYVRTCQEVNYQTDFLGYEPRLYVSEDLDAMLSLYSPTEIIIKTDNLKFDIYDNYFCITDNDSIISFYNEYDYYKQYDDMLMYDIWDNLENLIDVLEDEVLDIIFLI